MWEGGSHNLCSNEGPPLSLSLSPLAGLSGEKAFCQWIEPSLVKGNVPPSSSKLGGGSGDRFGDYLCMDCANVP